MNVVHDSLEVIIVVLGPIDCNDFRVIGRKEGTTCNEWWKLANNTNLDHYPSKDHLHRINHVEDCEIMKHLNQR